MAESEMRQLPKVSRQLLIFEVAELQTHPDENLVMRTHTDTYELGFRVYLSSRQTHSDANKLVNIPAIALTAFSQWLYIRKSKDSIPKIGYI